MLYINNINFKLILSLKIKKNHVYIYNIYKIFVKYYNKISVILFKVNTTSLFN